MDMQNFLLYSNSSFSFNETELKSMDKAVREAEKTIAKVDYTLTEKQKKEKDFSRSLYVVQDIKKGEKISEENVKSIRPGFGLHPKYLNEILGEKAKENLIKGDRLNFKNVDV